VHRSGIGGTSVLLAAALLILGAGAAAAQVRRSGGPPPGGVPTTPPGGIPRGGASARYPYAGAWDGSFSLSVGPGAGRRVPIAVAFDVVDSARQAYAGATILPGDARAPHLETRVRDGEMRWTQANSGGGYWHYTARLATPDSIVGTLVLRDWPQLPPGERPPAGTLALVRRRAPR
jgi:hypothetical protein